MSRKSSTLLAIINAARFVAADELQEAAEGRRSRLPAFLAAVALDATHAYLKVFGDREGEVSAAQVVVIRNEPLPAAAPCQCGQCQPRPAAMAPAQDFGPN